MAELLSGYCTDAQAPTRSRWGSGLADYDLCTFEKLNPFSNPVWYKMIIEGPSIVIEAI